MTQYILEIREGQDQNQRVVEADHWSEKDGWIIFYRRQTQGGTVEYWRIQREFVVCMETKP